MQQTTPEGRALDVVGDRGPGEASTSAARHRFQCVCDNAFLLPELCPLGAVRCPACGRGPLCNDNFNRADWNDRWEHWGQLTLFAPPMSPDAAPRPSEAKELAQEG